MGLSGRAFDRFMQGASILVEEKRRQRAIAREDRLRIEQNTFDQDAATVKADAKRKSDTLKQQLDLLKFSAEAKGATPETKAEATKMAFGLVTGKDVDLSEFEFKLDKPKVKASERLVTPNVQSFKNAFGEGTQATIAQVTDFMDATTRRLKQEQARDKKETATFTSAEGKKADVKAHIDLIDGAIELNLKFLQKDKFGRDALGGQVEIKGNLREVAAKNAALFNLRRKIVGGGTLTPEDETLFGDAIFQPAKEQAAPSQEGLDTNTTLLDLAKNQLESAKTLNEQVKNR